MTCVAEGATTTDEIVSSLIGKVVEIEIANRPFDKAHRCEHCLSGLPTITVSTYPASSVRATGKAETND